MVRKKSFGIKDIIAIIIIGTVLGDFFFNDRILLTKFATKFTETTSSIGQKVGEWWKDKFIESTNNN